jgi:glycosyltransferase involved in cell wall biosynthesis
MSIKMNLIFFLPNFSKGGAANSIVRLCEKLDKKKYSIYIISIGKNSYKNEIKKFCKKIYELKFQKTIFSFLHIRKIVRQIIAKNTKTLFISNINYANVLSIIFLRNIEHLKIILVERTSINELDIYFSFKDFIKKKIIKVLMIFIYKKADKIIANSKTVAKLLKNLTNTKIFYIYPPSVKKVYEYKKPKFNKKKCLRILTTGRLAIEKNLKIIILSLKYLDFDNFKLFILGSGPEKNELLNFVIKNKLQHKVKFFPHTDNLNKFYKNSDLFINSSHFEGFPNSVVEAINYNLPVICSRSGGGIQEILMNGRLGTFFDTNNYLSLSKKINIFRKDPNLFYKKIRLAKNNIRKFTQENNLALYNQIFSSLLR